jgi:hypothetical protein
VTALLRVVDRMHSWAILFTWWQQCLMSSLLMCLKEVTRLNGRVLDLCLTHPSSSQPPAASIDTLTGTLLCRHTVPVWDMCLM